ncbi:EAL domain-containing protein [Corallincola platygyrae]|uniref:EAL domain-containing protein n=1 Tax=Corallincola platygyrae TaxID=1193278 RepID=A0ABW4XS34_9GAMM
MIRSASHEWRSEDLLASFVATNQLGQGTTLVQVFSNDNEHVLKQALRAVHTQLPNATVIGCSAYGFIRGDKRELEGTLLSFTQFESTHLHGASLPIASDSYSAGQDLAKTLVHQDTKAMILFADPVAGDVETLLKGIASIAPQVMVAGGLSADHFDFSGTRTLLGQEILTNQVTGVSLSGEQLHLCNHHCFGWRPVGKPMTITKVDGSRVYQIDNESAQIIFNRYLGADACQQIKNHAIDFPLLIERGDMAIARAPMQQHGDGSISFAGNFRAGDKVRFAYGDKGQLASITRGAISKLPLEDAEALFVYGCAGRSHYLGNSAELELEALSDAPHTCGFFAFGELYHQFAPLLLNHTHTYLALSETKPLKLKQLELQTGSSNTQAMSEAALFNLIRTTSDELTELNNRLESKVEEKTEALHRQYYRHSITGLPNRRQLLRDMRPDSPFIPAKLCLFNIDGFRQINDFFGSHTGDQVLLNISQKLERVFAQYLDDDYLKLYKLPSDEFALAGTAEIANALFLEVAGKMEREVEGFPIQVADSHFDIQITCGLALPSSTGSVPQADQHVLLSQADLALRQARQSHKNSVIYEENMPILAVTSHNLAWTRKLKKAIREQRVIAYYQPLYDLSSGRICNYEALARVIDEEGNIVPPNSFLDVSKKSRLYHHITQAVLNQSVELFRGTGARFSINLTLQDLRHQETLRNIYRLVEDRRLAQQITFELVESDSFEDYDLVHEFLTKVKQCGCRVAIDDFGAGYASFERLATLEVDYLKLDGSLIKSLDIDPKMAEVTRTIVEFATRLNMRTTAEFVHNEAIHDKVKEMGFHIAQGFHLSHPIPAEQVKAQLECRHATEESITDEQCSGDDGFTDPGNVTA